MSVLSIQTCLKDRGYLVDKVRGALDLDALVLSEVGKSCRALQTNNFAEIFFTMRVVGRARSWGGARRSFSHHQISTSTIIIIILNYHCRQCHNHIHQHSICPVLWGSGSSESMNIPYFYSAAQFCICWIENQPNTLIGIKNKIPS